MTEHSLVQCIQQKKPTKPLWMFRQAGRYLPEYRALRKQEPDFLKFCYSPKKCVQAVMQPIERFDLQTAIVFSDILVIPDALGQRVWFEGGVGPKLTPLNAGDLTGNLRIENFSSCLKPVYEGVSGMVEALGDKELIGFSGAPWTLACYMIEGQGSRDFFAARRAAITDATFSNLIRLLEEATVQHLSHQIDAGAKVVQLFDSWSGILSLDLFTQYVIAPTRRIVTALKTQYPHVPIMGFARGAGDKIQYFAENSLVDVVTLDETFDRGAFLKNDQSIWQGNLDPVYLLGSKEALAKEVLRWKSDTEDKPWIYNLGHGVHKDTDPEMVQYMIDCLRA